MESNIPQDNATNAPQTPIIKTGKNHKIIIGVLVALVILLVLASLWLVRQNRKNQSANNTQGTVVNNVVNSTNTSGSNTSNTTNNSSQNNTSSSNNTSNTSTNNSTQNSGNATSGTPQVVSSSPASSASVDEGSVASVSVTFDRALDSSSLLSVTKESLPYHVGTGIRAFSTDKKTMLLSINSNSNSVYTIHYTACTAANTNCSTGNISFTVGTAGKVPAENVTR